MAYPAVPTNLREVHPRMEAGTALSFGLESTRKFSRYCRWPKPGIYGVEEEMMVRQVCDCHGNHVTTMWWPHMVSCDIMWSLWGRHGNHVITMWWPCDDMWWPCDDHRSQPSNRLWLNIRVLGVAWDYRPPFQWVWFTWLGETGN